jgi:hypothetical protein
VISPKALQDYPLHRDGAGVVLGNHQQGGLTSDLPGGLSVGGLVATLVIPVTVNGNFLVSGTWSYLVAIDPTQWQLVRRTGAFTVNGAPPAAGLFLFPTDAGGTTTTLLSTANLLPLADTVTLGALDISGATVGQFVAYEFLLSNLPPGGFATFPGASPSSPQGQFSALEVL